MNNNFDLDINNYTIYDLLQFFKLEIPYNNKEINNKYDFLKEEISKNLNDEQFKKKMFIFINSAKNTLQKYIDNIDNKGSGYVEDDNLHNGNNIFNQTTTITAGGGNSFIIDKDTTSFNDILNKTKYLNPLETYPSNLSRGSLNVLKRKSILKTLSFNTLFRQNIVETMSTNSEFKLPFILKNVISLNLVSVEFPCGFYVFSDAAKNNTFYIKEMNTNLEGIITIPEGNYTTDTLISTMKLQINKTLPNIDRFDVTFDPITGKITILNSINEFTLNFLYLDSSNKIYNKFGWIIGYRKSQYKNDKSYTTESILNTSSSEYFYFYLNDYNISNCDKVVAVFDNNYLENNILAKIPIVVDTFQYVYNNNSDFITKKRDFFGPVNIDKINVRIYNKFGEILFINNMDFSFTIEFEILYDL
jgi:hypothetical protein